MSDFIVRIFGRRLTKEEIWLAEYSHTLHDAPYIRTSYRASDHGITVCDFDSLTENPVETRHYTRSGRLKEIERFGPDGEVTSREVYPLPGGFFGKRIPAERKAA